MFTGLVERTGKISDISKARGDSTEVWTLKVDPGIDYERDLGASVAVNGVCLSEVGREPQGILTFHVSPETLSKTSLNELTIGAKVNLERAMRPTDRLGGHIVLGHVDGTGAITELKKESGFWILKIKIPSELAKYVVSKGSIAIDGVSLTVNEISDYKDHSFLTFTLVPITWETTRFSEVKVGSIVNLEVDMIAKHVERLSVFNLK